jgi:hypothetical protein
MREGSEGNRPDWEPKPESERGWLIKQCLMRKEEFVMSSDWKTLSDLKKDGHLVPFGTWLLHKADMNKYFFLEPGPVKGKYYLYDKSTAGIHVASGDDPVWKLSITKPNSKSIQ